MKLTLSATLFELLILAGPARAEFQMAPTRLDTGAPAQASPQPIVLYTDVQASTVTAVRRPRIAASPAIPIALGFGRQVPLAFATRQIVPAGVKITFGPDVKQDALVDWSGGRPWMDTLRVAARPLGLRVSVGWKAVSITRT